MDILTAYQAGQLTLSQDLTLLRSQLEQLRQLPDQQSVSKEQVAEVVVWLSRHLLSLEPEDQETTYHLSIWAWYHLPSRKLGQEALDKVLFGSAFPAQLRSSSLSNCYYYLEKLDHRPLSLDKLITNYFFEARLFTLGPLKPCNPSLIKLQTGYSETRAQTNYLLNVRYVNFDPYQNYAVSYPEPYNYADTVNVLFQLDSNFRVVRHHLIEDKSNRPVNPQARVRGFEDMRLYLNATGQCYAVATVLDHQPYLGAKVGWLKLDRPANHDLPYQVTDCQILPYPELDRAEKNWVPLLLTEDEPKLVYQLSPLTLVQPTNLAWSPQIVASDPALDLSSLRGSSPYYLTSLFDDQPTYLGLVHQVLPQKGRTYVHRFVLLAGRDLTVKKVSAAFTLGYSRIEYISSLTLLAEEAIIGYGVDDAQVGLARVSYQEIKRLFR